MTWLTKSCPSIDANFAFIDAPTPHVRELLLKYSSKFPLVGTS